MLTLKKPSDSGWKQWANGSATKAKLRWHDVSPVCWDAASCSMWPSTASGFNIPICIIALCPSCCRSGLHPRARLQENPSWPNGIGIPRLKILSIVTKSVCTLDIFCFQKGFPITITGLVRFAPFAQLADDLCHTCQPYACAIYYHYHSVVDKMV